ncbi:molecular chaperone TorD family protein [Caenispirillum bisanense]|uniref:TorD/DmsD family molecular chaperone n=1 Tax=Caenispirillum bisanense TaxID=414052 RepID=UPI0031CE5CFB
MSAVEGVSTVGEEDALRAHFYALLSRLTLAPPSAGNLRDLSALAGDDTDMGQALAALGRAAAATSAAEAEDEHTALFIGISRGEVVPFASYYLTGFLNEKPLAEVRQTLAELGVERSADRPEPEDHVGILFEVMYGIVLGRLADGRLEAQKAFFDKHIEPWAEALFRDIEQAPSARFYRPLGTIGRLFVGIERDSLAMLGEKGEG